MRTVTHHTLALAAALSVQAGASSAAPSCEGLSAWHTDTPTSITITQAQWQDAPQPYCRVRGVARPSADSDIRFEVWLPAASAWTGRLKVNGTGGFAGGVPTPRMAQDVALGFVAAGSNMGHDGGESAAWALHHPERVMDWGVRAHAEVAAAAKALTQAYYGRPAQHAYFEGCSNGGRQGMVMAQRHPALFDGIVAGAPSMFYPQMVMTLLWTGRQLLPTPDQAPLLGAAQRSLLHRHALQSCDAQDGLADGLISQPRACHPDLDALRCTSSSADRQACLSDAELAVARQVYAGPHTRAGQPLWPGPLPGSELEWAPQFADDGGYGRFVGHVVRGQDSPPFDWRGIDFDTDPAPIVRALTPLTAAPSADLSAFRAHGGKLIQYHGWHDAIVTPQGSPNYVQALAQFERLKGLPNDEYARQVDALTPADLAVTTLAQAGAVQQYHRLFMLPGVSHCGGGGGPDAIGGGAAPEPPPGQRDADHDVLQALLRWVELGVAPDTLIATRLDTTGRPERQRPLCPYPQRAAYNGQSDINAASSFHCAASSPAELAATPVDLLQVQTALRQRLSQ
jgi:feruloyl esterase